MLESKDITLTFYSSGYDEQFLYFNVFVASAKLHLSHVEHFCNHRQMVANSFRWINVECDIKHRQIHEKLKRKI